ncbi:MAG: NAD-dependent epimerase/dehydratase family protein [Nitriliruptorales bacterium]
MAGKRVLVTGISHELAGLVATALEQRAEVDYLAGVDVREPRHDLRRTEFVGADVRDPAVARVIAAADVDTVVHMAFMSRPGAAGGRARMKEQNVIGTMQLLGACQKSPSLRKVVLQSSTAVYGSDYTDPALLTEDATPRLAPKDGFAKDMTEVEGYARTLGRRRSDVSVTILRFADLIGGPVESVFARYFSLPVVPTMLGFDPRLQFCHTDDAVAVLVASCLEDHAGIFNVAGPGVLYLSQAVRMAGRVALPIPKPFLNSTARFVRRSRRLDFAPEQLNLLQFGRIADIARLRGVFGYEPRFSSRQAFADFVARRRIPGEDEGGEHGEWQQDLYDFIRRHGMERASAARNSGGATEDKR